MNTSLIERHADIADKPLPVSGWVFDSMAPDKGAPPESKDGH
jgi:hypothetical protein